MTPPLACLLSVESGSKSISTGKERDTESGLDYFGARYYASTMGRFMSPDWSAQAEPVPYAKLGNPQTLNLYGYMQNNPLGGVDQDGHCGQQAGSAPQCSKAAGGDPTKQVPQPVKQAIDNSVKASNAKNADDKKGGNHEEGGVAYTKDGKQVIAPAQPGAAGTPGAGAKVQIDPTKAADPNLQKPDGTAADITWHVHPSGEGTPVVQGGASPFSSGTVIGGSTTTLTPAWSQPPSAVDIQNAGPGLNLVIGAGNSGTQPTVYVYTNSGCTCQESYKDFKKP